MKITQDNLPEIVSALRASWYDEQVEWLEEIYEHNGSLFGEIPVKLVENEGYDVGEIRFHTHHTLGRTIRNWLIDYGIDPVEDGVYLLDEIWCNVAEMALEKRKVSMEELSIQEYLND